MFLLLYSQLGYFVTGKLSQYQLKQAAKEKIWNDSPDSCFKKIVLTGNEKNISWEEEGREFLFDGLMYDVVRTRIANDSTTLLCVNDEIEDRLIQHLNDITKTNHQEDGNRHATPVFKLLFCDTFLEPSVNCFSLAISCVPVAIHYTAALSNQPGTIHLPPPRCFM